MVPPIVTVWMVIGFAILFAFYKYGAVKGWWDPKAAKAAKANRRVQRRRVR